jgi:glycosyltransferase involved in cell wall biosynthesis
VNVESLAQESTEKQESGSPRVSVIIVTYNYGHFLGEAMQSVLDQTFQDWEVIVVDDGSTDNTREVVEAFGDPRIHYVYQENQGNPAARNTALRLVKGEYIAFLDADDVWFPEKLQKQVAQLDGLAPTVGLVYGDVYLFNHDDGAIIGRFLQGRRPPTGRVFGQLLEPDGWFISDTASLIRREVFDRIGLYDQNLLTYEDWEMWVRIASAYEVEALDEPLARCRRHGSNLGKRVEEMYRYGLAARRKVMASYSLNPQERRVLKRNLAQHEYTYGTGLLQLGRRREAWKAFFRSVRLRPDRRETYVHLGLPLLSPRLYNLLSGSYSTVKGWLSRAK